MLNDLEADGIVFTFTRRRCDILKLLSDLLRQHFHGKSLGREMARQDHPYAQIAGLQTCVKTGFPSQKCLASDTMSVA